MNHPKKESSGRWPWWEKVDLCLNERTISVRKFALAIGRKQQSMSRWLLGKGDPTDPTLLPDIAAYLGWTVDYLTDESLPFFPRDTLEERRVRAAADLEAMARDLSPDAGRIVKAVADPRKLSWLLRCLDQYEEYLSQQAKEK